MSAPARPFEVRLHGRGGQGVVTAAELLSMAAFLDGREAQAFPSFGSERMGAPVMAFCRIADTRVRAHEPVLNPDAVVVADATLLHHVDVFAGLRDDGFALINSVHDPEQIGLADLVARLGPGRVRCVPASDIAREKIGRPVPNICLLGALAATTWIVTLDSLAAAVRSRFAEPIAAGNIAALQAAADLTAVGHA